MPGPASEAGRFLRFALVGGTGFAVDAAILAILSAVLAFDPFSARLVSMSIATLVTWRLNRAHTFPASDKAQVLEGMRYATVAALACGANYGAYALALVVLPGLSPIAALVFATAVAMGVSYAGYSRFVFSDARTIVGSPSSQRR